MWTLLLLISLNAFSIPSCISSMHPFIFFTVISIKIHRKIPNLHVNGKRFVWWHEDDHNFMCEVLDNRLSLFECIFGYSIILGGRLIYWSLFIRYNNYGKYTQKYILPASNQLKSKKAYLESVFPPHIYLIENSPSSLDKRA